MDVQLCSNWFQFICDIDVGSDVDVLYDANDEQFFE